MEELYNKIIVGIVVALLVFVMQSKKVHELIIGLFGGTAPPVIVALLDDNKEQGKYWESVEKCDKKECYALYLDKYPQGNFVDIAKVQLGIDLTASNNTPVVPPTPIKDQPVIIPMPPVTMTISNDKGKRIEHYRVYKNGTAFDTKHNLLWMRCSLGQTWTGSRCSGTAKTFNWEQAKKQRSNFAGYSTWHLPTFKELRTLVYCSNGSPDYFSMGMMCKGEQDKDYKFPTILQTVFPDTKRWYWSSSPSANYNDYAWVVYFFNGNGAENYTNDSKQVRLVASSLRSDSFEQGP